MEHNKLTYRFLDHSDIDTFISLHDSTDMWMSMKKDPARIELYRNFRKNLFLNPYNKTVGAFDVNDTLVAATAGWFPPDFPYWYTHGQIHNVENKSLSGGTDSWMILLKLMDLLSQHGEENNYFSFYNHRAVKHQRAIEKVRQQIEDKKLFQHRYDLYWENVYPAGKTTEYRNHKFYFPKEADFSHTDTVVVLYTLKQQYRLEKLNKK